MVVNARSLKRMKRRVTAELYDFLNFPVPESGDRLSGGPFRSNVKAFLARHALLPSPSSLLPHLVTWQVRFRVGDSVDDSVPGVFVSLDVVEEDVARSRSVYCDQCRVVGESNMFESATDSRIFSFICVSSICCFFLNDLQPS